MDEDNKNSEQNMSDSDSTQKPELGMADKSHDVEFVKDTEPVEEVNSEDTDDQVDEIVKEESSQLLELEDEKRENRFDPPETKKSFKDKVISAFKTWWINKRLRYGTLAILFVLLVIAAFVPSTRYGILNTAGVRVESSMTVVDSKTGLPLKNIGVVLQNKHAVTDEDGTVSFYGLKLGSTKLTIQKIGYAEYDKKLTLGWGSNPIGPQPLTATGTEFSFKFVDWLSGMPILEVEVTSGENSAQSDESGRVVLNVGKLEDDTEATITVDGYRSETIPLSSVINEDFQVKLVPAKKHVFVSNRDADYDLYKIDVDGKNEEVLLKASGKEREVPFVVPHSTKNVAAYISSRDGEANKDGFILDGLFVVNVGSGDVKKVARSEQLQIIGWIGNKLVYVAVVEGVSAGSSERSKVFSYDIDSGDKVELASSNYFNDVKVINDKVYYSVSSYAVPNSSAKLFTVFPDGSDRSTLVDSQVWSIARTDYTTVLFNAIDQQWFEQNDGGDVVKLDKTPVNTQNRVYADSPNGEQAIWTDVRDGRGVLLKYDVTLGTDEVIFTESGVDSPVYWLSDNYIIFRISTIQETADYVMNLDGGEPMKVSDVVGNRSRYFY